MVFGVSNIQIPSADITGQVYRPSASEQKARILEQKTKMTEATKITEIAKVTSITTISGYDNVLDDIEELLGFEASTEDMDDYLLLDFDPDKAEIEYSSGIAIESITTAGGQKFVEYGEEVSVISGSDGNVLRFSAEVNDGLYHHVGKSVPDPDDWFILEVLVNPTEDDEDQIIVSKQTEMTCSKPLYELGITEDGKYYFSVTSGDRKYTAEGGSVSGTQKIIGVYSADNDIIYLYVDDELQATKSQSLSGSLVTPDEHYNMVIGNHVCLIDSTDGYFYEYEGFLEYVRLWGE